MISETEANRQSVGAMTSASNNLDPKLLDILRCPVAVHYKDKGDDPGRLELVRDYWLVSADSGCKYPIVDGIPKMLVEEGERWKETDIDDLPVPPPNEPVTTAAAEEALTPEMSELARQFGDQADEARVQAVKQLNAAASAIRQEAQSENPDGGITRHADEVASGLERAAQFLNTHSIEQMGNETVEAARNNPRILLSIMFLLGLFLGLLVRRGGTEDN